MNIHGCQLHPKIAIYVVKQLKNDSYCQGLYCFAFFFIMTIFKTFQEVYLAVNSITLETQFTIRLWLLLRRHCCARIIAKHSQAAAILGQPAAESSYQICISPVLYKILKKYYLKQKSTVSSPFLQSNFQCGHFNVQKF